MGLDAEVIVVGAGPAGSATAALLARAGHDVLLLDRARFPRPKACAEYLSPATADALARLGALPALERHGPVRPLGMELIGQGTARVLIRYQDGTASRRALCVSRRVLDATLLAHARAQGARVREGCQVVGVVAAAGGASVAVRDVARPAAERHELRCRLVVGADGAGSAVARSLGLQRPVLWPRRTGFVAHYRGEAAAARLAHRGEMHVGTGVYCGLAPLPEGMVNVGMVMDTSAARRAGSASAAFERGLDRLPAVRRALEGAGRVGAIRGASPLAVRVSRSYGDGFLLVGDAAGFLDPFTGEGVYRSLRGAELAASVAAAALRRGNASASALAPYGARRREEFGAKSVLCWLIQAFLLHPSLLAYALRRLDGRPDQGALLGGVLGDYRPAGEALRPSFLWGLLRP